MTTTEDILKKLFFDYFKAEARSVRALPAHASTRKYFILEKEELKAIGVYGPSLAENKAFFNIQKFFDQKGIRVPKFYQMDDSGFYYLQEYCGDTDVFSNLEISTNTLDLLKKSVQVLVDIQLKSKKLFDFSVCYPFARFDIDEIKREFRAFQYKYLLNKGIDLKEDFFQEDIDLLEKLIEEIPPEDYAFMHRDFQTRNLLLNANEDVVVIDFQGGREGPRYYDLASLIYSPESSYAHEYKNELIEFYGEKYGDKTDKKDFMKFFLIIALVRLVHTLGVYGSLGLEQNNPFFKKNIITAEKYLVEVLASLKSEFSIEFKNLTSLYNSSL
ncbi:MAG: phosphotransferase [Candidatus Pacebacteria bacterium]|nr:phosphotransferase [Candidatus Paceibacterota bacterium]MBP9851459.1 phosphotransferase [Candidatus Paceibacterota bacterium]